MDQPPVLLALSLDAVLRDGLTAGALLDVPGAVAIRYDVDAAAGVLDRAVLDVHGALDTARVPLDDGCVACTLRSDLLPALRRVACRRPAAVVLAPPATSEPAPLLAMLADAPGGQRPGAVLAAAHAGGLEVDLLGDALLVEAGLARSDDDRRAVGEVLAHQLEAADAVLLDVAPAPAAGTLLRHLVPAATRVDVLHETSPAALLDVRRAADDPRGDLRRPSPSGAPDADGVWTLDLSSWRPFHPGRFLDALEDLGGGRLRGRGRFWLPSRPFDLAGWDGAGGQVQVGPLGRWAAPGAAGHASTRLVVTGLDEDPGRVRAAFDRALVTDRELVRGAAGWHLPSDGLEPWLGPLRASA